MQDDSGNPNTGDIQFLKSLDDLRVVHEGTERALKESEAREASARERIAVLEEEMRFQKVEVARTLPKGRTQLFVEVVDLKEHIRRQARDIERLEKIVSSAKQATVNDPAEEDSEELEESRKMIMQLQVEVQKGEEILSIVIKTSEGKFFY